MSQALAAAPIKAGINQKKFLSSIKHLFAGHHSVLGELMQNARRAGATGVDFFFDAETSTLTVQDDGRGITDFAPLVVLAQSDWAEETVVSENPFGMGLFAAFTVASSVTFCSRGKKLRVTLEDIVESRELRVEDDPDAQQTRVTMEGLDAALCKPTFGSTLEQQLREFSAGFPLPIRFNGVDLPRPHAQSNLQGQQTSIGFASIEGIHTEDAQIDMTNPRLFLQGLPIGRVPWNCSSTVVHLDGSFQARMPDRSELYNAKDTWPRITMALKETCREHLLAEKARLPPQEFVVKHWYNCCRHGAESLLNDIPYIPKSLCWGVRSVALNEYDCWEQRSVADGELIARADVESGAVRIWIDIPECPDDHVDFGVILRVAQRLGIYGISARGLCTLPEGHWVRAVCPDASQFSAAVTPVGVVGSTPYYAGDLFDTVTITLVGHVDVVLTSAVDASFRVAARIAEDWVLQGCPGENEDSSWATAQDAVCYVMPEGLTRDHPVDVFSRYRDENDAYQEDWRDHAANVWDETLSTLRGTRLAGTVRRALELAPFHASKLHHGQYAIVSVVPYASPFDGSEENVTFKACDADENFWSSMAAALDATDAMAPLEQRLREALVATASKQFKPKSEAKN